jgi:hypothetical protein
LSEVRLGRKEEGRTEEDEDETTFEGGGEKEGEELDVGSVHAEGVEALQGEPGCESGLGPISWREGDFDCGSGWSVRVERWIRSY